jgi:polyphosphate kinase
MDDNEFKGRPDGNGSEERSAWSERVSLPDHLRPPLPVRRPAEEPPAPEEEEIALPVADPDLAEPETAPFGGILPESDAGDRASATSTGPRTTPPDTIPVPQAGPDGVFALEDSDLYLNRELTWLNFNYRVLAEAEDERVPLLERLKFVAIVSSNVDEFFMKRIGGLKQQVGAGVTKLSVDGRSAQEQIDESYATVRDLEARKRLAFLEVASALAEHDIVIASHDELPEEDCEWLRAHYVQNVYPLVTPQATDPAHPFPFISNLSLNLLVTLRLPGDPFPSLARVKVPVGTGTPRLLALPDRNVFVPLEQVMAANLDLLFPGMEIDACELFRVTRNANTEMEEDEADDLLAMIETELRQRKLAPIVRLEVTPDMDPVHRGMLAAELGLDEESDVFEMEGTLGLGDLWQVVGTDAPGLKDQPHHPVDHPQIVSDRTIFHSIRDSGSLLVHHPYESFSTSVERFLREASLDPKVRAIKMTVYRTSADSKAVDYLIEAARNGKQVTAVVELKARFDEAANIRWANRLSAYGIHVTYGVVGLKTHCKAILVVRQDYDGLRRYAHVGTGNYHAGTARLYADIGLLTADPDIGSDLTELFNYLTTGYKPSRNYRKILPAPKILKPAILAKIEREIQQHGEYGNGLIQMKLNALEDVDVTRALYEASRAGVKVDLVVRDTCRLRPGIERLSDNVRVVSIVGRFLEHSRVYYFHNGGDEEYYIGSADAMRRNLRSRVEIVAPVEDPELRSELRLILDTQLADRRSAWEMRADGSYEQRRPEGGENRRSSQSELIRSAEARHKEATRLKRRKPRGIRALEQTSEE